jgi:phosphoenolpyruvate carboxylase
MLRAAGLLEAGVQYNDLPEEEKMRLLQRELVNPRPLLARDAVISESARNVLDVFHVVREAQRHLSPRAVTAYIISMTHGTSDILEVLLLAKEAGLLRWTRDTAGLVLGSDIDVVPLFETIEDLERCDGLMRGLFADPAYRAHLNARGGFQEIMLGYSTAARMAAFSLRTGRRMRLNRGSPRRVVKRASRCGFSTVAAGRSVAVADAQIAPFCRSRPAASAAASVSPSRAK